ncbi:uncharacterized protein LOC141913183 [Tubulanus polymorphus]|uniref:uncharacterized protein LOC141913183 n=1 Tax=Tubulanus polymorphus TaxID=672921 RepID=UPI003DA54CFA
MKFLASTTRILNFAVLWFIKALLWKEDIIYLLFAILMVLRANKDWVLSQNAYMLFYIKVPTRTTADNSHQPDPQTRTTAHNSHQPDLETRTTADNSHQPDPQVCETFYTSPSRPCMCL